MLKEVSEHDPYTWHNLFQNTQRNDVFVWPNLEKHSLSTDLQYEIILSVSFVGGKYEHSNLTFHQYGVLQISLS